MDIRKPNRSEADAINEMGERFAGVIEEPPETPANIVVGGLVKLLISIAAVSEDPDQTMSMIIASLEMSYLQTKETQAYQDVRQAMATPKEKLN